MPELSAVHVNRPLTSISIAYIMNQGLYGADRVFPRVPVQKQSDSYWTFDKDDFLRGDFGVKAPGAAPEEGGYDVDPDNLYFTPVYAYGHRIPDQLRANADSELSLDRAATLLVTQKGMIFREKNFVDKFMKTGVWGTDVTGVDAGPGAGQFLQWDDPLSTPIEDIRAGMTAVHSATGFRPNKLTLSQSVWDKLVDHPDLVDRVKYSGGVGNSTPAKVTKEALAQLLELEEVIVLGGVMNSAKKGAASDVGFIAGKGALLTYTPDEPSLMMPSAGYTFSWAAFAGSEGEGVRIKKYRLEERFESDMIEGQMAYAQKQIAADLGVFFNTAVA